MKKYQVLLILVLASLVYAAIQFGVYLAVSQSQAAQEVQKAPQTRYEEGEASGVLGHLVFVLKDTKTGRQYLVVTDRKGGLAMVEMSDVEAIGPPLEKGKLP